MPNVTTTRTESELIGRIVRRALSLSSNFNAGTLGLDISAVHMNGCRLQLRKLLAANDLNFLRDILGITENIDRDPGNLENGFTPIFAAAQSAWNAGKARKRVK